MRLRLAQDGCTESVVQTPEQAREVVDGLKPECRALTRDSLSRRHHEEQKAPSQATPVGGDADEPGDFEGWVLVSREKCQSVQQGLSAHVFHKKGQNVG